MAALISYRAGELIQYSSVPRANDVFKEGDRITFIGHKEAVRDAIVYCYPE